MTQVNLRSKFAGSLVGTGVGDALGAGLEGRSAVDEVGVRALADRHDVLDYTDDTHMMIGVAESLIEMKGFDGEHMAHRFVENYDREPYRGYGPGPPRIFGMIKAGEAWDRAAARLYSGGSFGNGSAMRVAPVGLFYYDDMAGLRDTAYRSSEITHAHELGKEGAALQAYAVALATAVDPPAGIHVESFLLRLLDFCQHQTYKEKLETIRGLLGKADKSTVIGELGHGIEAFNSVPTAIYSFLSFPDSFADAVVYAISLGGDTDTIGAMTGAISGAYLGVEAVPAEWQHKLENREYIAGLAESLWEIRSAWQHAG